MIRYCSLDCFKSHECNPPVQKTPIQPQKRGPRPLQLDSDDETDLLTSEQLQSLNCDAMTQLLGKWATVMIAPQTLWNPFLLYKYLGYWLKNTVAPKQYSNDDYEFLDELNFEMVQIVFIPIYTQHFQLHQTCILDDY